LQSRVFRWLSQKWEEKLRERFTQKGEV
jgi:hypothetical protein